MTTIDRENLRTVYSTYKRYARLMCEADADMGEIQDAVDDACEAAHACTMPWKVVETIHHMANEVAVLEKSDPEKASELEDTHLAYIESL